MDRIQNMHSDFVFADVMSEKLDKEPHLLDYDGEWEYVNLN